MNLANRPLLDKKAAQKHAFCPKFSLSPLRFTAIFEHEIGILHHLALLFGRQLAIFHRPKNSFLPLKRPILANFLPQEEVKSVAFQCF